VRDVQLTPPFWAPVDSFMNTTKGLRSIASQYAISDEATELRPAPGSREVTPSSGKEASSDIAIYDAVEGGKKMCKQHLQAVTVAANDDDGHCEKVGGFSVMIIMPTISSDKH
jgi:hypothetical protein